MASFIQLRGDTIDRFLEFDPVLGIREPALVSVDAENTTLYTHMKVGDGVHKFSELPLLDLGGNIVSYNDLNDLPSIGGIQIKGDLSLEQLGIASSDSLKELDKQFVKSKSIRGVEVLFDSEAPMQNDDVMYIEVAQTNGE